MFRLDLVAHFPALKGVRVVFLGGDSVLVIKRCLVDLMLTHKVFACAVEGSVGKLSMIRRVVVSVSVRLILTPMAVSKVVHFVLRTVLRTRVVHR